MSCESALMDAGYSEPFDPADRQASMAYYGDAAQSKRKWAARLLELQHRCATLLEAGGADYVVCELGCAEEERRTTLM